MWNMRWAKHMTIAAAVMLAALGSNGCSDSSSPTSTGGSGTLRMKLVDTPLLDSGVEAVTVTFSSVRVHSDSAAEDSGSGWIEVVGNSAPPAERTFNLLDLVGGVSAVLGQKQLAAGAYTQIRLIVENATITVDGNVLPLTIPSGSQTGIKLVQGFSINPNEVTELTLDFDVEQSVRQTGNGDYMMRPTIRVVQTVLSGSISGTALPIAIGAVVKVYSAGTTTLVTTTYADPLTGHFEAQGLLPGTYDVVIEATGFSAATVTGIVVTAGAENAGHDETLIVAGP